MTVAWDSPVTLARTPAAAVAVALIGGIVVSTTSPGPLAISAAAFAGCTLVLEFLRRKAVPTVPWWTAQAPVIPWAVIVLVPWAYFVREGNWTLLGASISLSLTHTWTIHLLALLGLTLGSALALFPTRPRVLSDAENVDWPRVSAYIGIAMGLYFVSFVLAQRPLAALWRLSGNIRYFDNPDQATGLGVLDYMTTVATGILLVAATVRRRDHPYPGVIEIGWLLFLVVLTLGSGSRGRLYLVAIGWLLVQTRPSFTRASIAGRVAMAAAGAAVIVAALSLAGTISVLRTGGLETQKGTAVETAIRGLDVMGSGELLVMRGGTPGILGGRSYTEFPQLLIPRRYAGAEKITPSADALIRSRLDPQAGFSAPLWFEPLLNFGRPGVLVFMSVVSWLAVMVLRRSADRVGSRFAACVHRLGPVWVLLGYLSLSRLTSLQLVLTVGATIGGVYVGARCVRSAGSATMALSVLSGEGYLSASSSPATSTRTVSPSA